MGKDGGGASAAAAANAKIDEAIQEQRRQFGETSQTFQPFIDAGAGALQGQVQGSTAGGLGQILSQLFNGGALQPLVDERTRAAQGQLAAGGLTRSGTALETISAIPQDIGLAIESMLNQRQGILNNQGFTAVQNVGQLGAQKSGNVGASLTQQGQNTSSGILADAQAKNAGISNAINLASSAAMAFSDPRLKTNVVRVSELGDLGVYQWDWIEEAKDTSIYTQPTLGFMADEVADKYPEFAGTVCGWKAILYNPLLDHLEDKFVDKDLLAA